MSHKNHIFLIALLLVFSRTLVWADPAAGQNTQNQDRILQAGWYSAKVKAIPCDACPPVIEKTMLQQKGIGSASVNQKTSTLTFQVKDSFQVKLSDLQSALKAASDEMGMGADYQLHELKGIPRPG